MFRAVLSEAPNNCQLYTQEWYRPRRSQTAGRNTWWMTRSWAAFASSKHHTNYTQLRNEVLILPVKLKETLTVNYVFTWDFRWVLNVNLHVQIRLPADWQLYKSLSLLMLMGELHKQILTFILPPNKPRSSATQPVTPVNVTNRPHSCPHALSLPYRGKETRYKPCD